MLKKSRVDLFSGGYAFSDEIWRGEEGTDKIKVGISSDEKEEKLPTDERGSQSSIEGLVDSYCLIRWFTKRKNVSYTFVPQLNTNIS